MWSSSKLSTEQRSTAKSKAKASSKRQKAKNKNFAFLKCTSSYPADPSSSNLRSIELLRKKFKCEIGLSDHTKGIGAAVASVAFGATIIEKHFTLNKNYKEGTDHILSATPDELKKIIDTTKEISELLGDGIKAPRECEIEIVEFVRNRFVG